MIDGFVVKNRWVVSDMVGSASIGYQRGCSMVDEAPKIDGAKSSLAEIED